MAGPDWNAQAGSRAGFQETAPSPCLAPLAQSTALGLEPDRAIWLRALMAELERLAISAMSAICMMRLCNDAAHCGILREKVLRTADVAFVSPM